ncbi:MAG TPA: tyrosine-type recombinase/integrase [Oligoflexus sp.]|uniref:tyrosine-type recombinase/integrase n=1 Tax=Oligoflexus sp. TaxID=1971216 RepID=UPI002D7EEBA2|nr:tyrosine-type recombinase/integrase [Oligoflexus sp.]HET9241012.1 tyrosine-type recombinase/integrase [Oligoflexus sp.]
MKKFNPKVYQGKDRVYPPVPGAPNVRKILIWDENKKEYRPPERGKLYFARRYERDSFGRKNRRSEYFESLEHARDWLSFIDKNPQHVPAVSNATSGVQGPTFREVVEEWKVRKFPGLRQGTRVHYDQIVQRHFQMLMDYPINSVSPKVIDEWLADRKSNIGQYPQAKKRTGFEGELDVLKVIFHYYGEYHDEDTVYRNPIRKRHLQDAKLNVSRPPKKLDVSEQEFYIFRDELEKLKDGHLFSVLATLQYFSALRISEAAAIHWEDIRFNWSDPKESRIQIVRYVENRQEKGGQPTIEAGFKNSKSTGGVKELPMFPQTFHALKRLYRQGKRGLVFHDESGAFFKYHVIKARYNLAFEKAGLPYTSTHVMRHGWTREVLDCTHGDFAVAGQLLGNTDRESINTYAKRNKGALTLVAHQKWEECTAQHETGRNWSQIEAVSN